MINNVVLIGRLTKDPDLRYTASGTAAASFTLAVNRNFTNQNGEREADFINCVMWRKAAENLANLARKGALIAVTGRIQTRNYENQQGQRVYVTEVIAEHFQLLEKKAEGAYRDAGSTQNSFEGNYTSRTQNSSQGNLGVNPMDRHENNFSGSSVDISDDDLPF